MTCLNRNPLRALWYGVRTEKPPPFKLIIFVILYSGFPAAGRMATVHFVSGFLGMVSRFQHIIARRLALNAGWVLINARIVQMEPWYFRCQVIPTCRALTIINALCA